MNIIILNITKNWIYRLYEEYILSIKKFINENYKNINIDILFFEISSFDINNINFDQYNIIFYSGDIDIINLILDKINNNYNKLYFINIEQMSHSSYYKLIRNVNINLNIIDYSEENIPFFKNIYNNVFLIPPYFNFNFNNKNNKKIDVLSFNNNEYRNNILKNIKDKLDNRFNILLLNDCYHDIRDKYFSESKIYINIHCSDNHQTMEMIRIVNLIMNKVIIISQKSVYSDLLFLNKYIIVCDDTHNLNNYLNDILLNYDYYYNKIYSQFSNEQYYNYIKNNIDKLIDNINLNNSDILIK